VAGRCADLDNLSAACLRAAARQDGPGAVRLLELAWEALRLRGPFSHGLELAGLVVACTGGLGPAERARVAAVLGAALWAAGRLTEAAAALQAGLVLAVESSDSRTEGRLCCLLAQQEIDAGLSDGAQQRLQRAQQIAADLDDATLACWALTELGALAQARGELSLAGSHFEAALGWAAVAADVHREVGLLSNLGVLAHCAGRLEEARPLYERSLALAEVLADRRWGGNTHSNLGMLHLDQGRPQVAAVHFDQALHTARDSGQVSLEATVLCNLALAEEAQGRVVDALAHATLSVTLARQAGMRRAEGQFLGYLARIQAKAGKRELARESRRQGEDLLTKADDCLSLGVLLCCAAEAEMFAGEASQARELLVRAARLAARLDPAAGQELEGTVGKLRAILTSAVNDMKVSRG
jgi:tetratricopeptide (TPR) repeat protein